VSTVLEGIGRVSRRGRPDIGFEGVAVHHVDGTIKQARDVVLEACIIEHSDGSISTMMSISLLGWLSPRATEPNTAALRTPRARRSDSDRRRVSRTSLLFISQNIAQNPSQGQRSRVVPPGHPTDNRARQTLWPLIPLSSPIRKIFLFPPDPNQL
jgi:hypothetical protein